MCPGYSPDAPLPPVHGISNPTCARDILVLVPLNMQLVRGSIKRILKRKTAWNQYIISALSGGYILMRTLMLIASVAMIASGVFCVANGSAAFLTVAFIIGLVYLVMGAIEILVGLRADFDVSENAVSITKDGILMMIFGIVIITGQITDDSSARILIAAWLVIEGVLAYTGGSIDIMHINTEARVNLGVNFIMFIFGMYMFFDNVLLDMPATFLIGIGMMILGLRRFMQSFVIEYSRPGFVTGNEEKLQEALDDEKRALAKAKEGIREQKNAQRRIQKIREDIEAEKDVMNSAAIRRAERELERESEQ